MKLSRYQVFNVSRNGTVLKYVVCAAENAAQADSMPDAAEFTIKGQYTAEIQRHHAQVFADYLNKIQQATEEAYEQNMLIDILKK